MKIDEVKAAQDLSKLILQSEDFDLKKLSLRTERRNKMHRELDQHADSLHQVNSTLALGARGSDLYIKTVDRISSYIGY